MGFYLSINVCLEELYQLADGCAGCSSYYSFISLIHEGEGSLLSAMSFSCGFSVSTRNIYHQFGPPLFHKCYELSYEWG